MELPSDLSAALDLLRRSESSQDHEESADLLTDAIHLIDEYLDENPDSAHAPRMRNLKLTHTRRILSDITNAGHLNFVEWAGYLLLLIGKLEPEVQQLMAQDPNLRSGYDRFKKSHRDELRPILKSSGLV